MRFVEFQPAKAHRNTQKQTENLVQVVKFFSGTVLRAAPRLTRFPALLPDAAPGYSGGETRPERSMSAAHDGAPFTDGAQ
nr:conserved hypothetical protein [Rhizobiaceae bacterium]